MRRYFVSKKNELMYHAIRLFSRKGFYQTSVQEIAQAAGISKGAFYKHFDSKNSILLAILEQYHEKVIAKASTTDFPEQLTKKEIFIEKLAAELNEWLTNRSFFTVVFKEFPPNQNEQISTIMKKLRLSMIELHKTSLLDTYGTKIQPFISDLVIMLEGILKEYILLVTIQRQEVSVKKLAKLIFTSMDAIVQNIDHMEPVLVNDSFETAPFDLEQEMEKRLLTVEEIIHNAITLHMDKEKLLSSVRLLTEEIKKSEPKQFLMEALMTYLKQEKTLEKEVFLLENRLETFMREV